MAGRLRRKNWPQLVVSISLVALFVGGWWFENAFLADSGWQRPLGQLAPGEYDVERVVDGDTILLRQNQLRVRLQGIDAPETVKPGAEVEAWGTEATHYVEQFLHDCQWRVRLEILGEPVDRYGRHLAFVWHEGRLLNEELVSQGLARAKTSFDFHQAMKQRLRAAEQEAKSAQRGLWQADVEGTATLR